MTHDSVMARSTSQRIELLENTRDAIEDALYASGSSADVISYSIAGRSVTRSRLQAQQELTELENRISRLKMQSSGPAVNHAVLRRASR